MILLSLLAAGLPAASQDGPAASAVVERWASILDSPDASPEDRESALVALRSLAAGLRDQPDTREASFALAGHWADPGAGSRTEAIRTMTAATSLYPDDPRTPAMLERLIEVQLASGDDYGAHLAYRQRIGSDPAAVPPAILASGAACAARAGDHGAALHWALATDPASLDREGRIAMHMARLIAGEALGRFDQALESADWLASEEKVVLRVTPRALEAAGHTYEATGLLDKAIEQYTALVNIFADAELWPERVLDLGRLLARTGRPDRARRYLQWLVEQSPESSQAMLARLEMMELGDEPARVSDASAYLDVIRNAPDMASSRAACDRFVLRFLGAGHVLELVTALRNVVVDPSADPDALYPLVAKDAVLRSLDPMLALLVAREDSLALAAASVEITAMHVPVPPHHRDAVARAREKFGLSPLPEGPVEAGLIEARAAMAKQDWSGAVDALNLALVSDRSPLPSTEVRARALIGEALWRDGQADEALRSIDAALERFPEPALARPLIVLRADIRFSRGDWSGSCEDYRRAAETEASRWVSLQLERCSDPAATAGAESGPAAGSEEKES